MWDAGDIRQELKLKRKSPNLFVLQFREKQEA